MREDKKRLYNSKIGTDSKGRRSKKGQRIIIKNSLPLNAKNTNQPITLKF